MVRIRDCESLDLSSILKPHTILFHMKSYDLESSSKIKWNRRSSKQKTQKEKWVIHKTLGINRWVISKKKFDLLHKIKITSKV